MDRFSYCLPTHFEFGEDAELEVGRLVSRFSGTKALIVLGEGSARRSGLFARVRTSLDRALLEYAVLSGVQPASQLELVREGIDLARDERVDFILAIGGGSVIDVAKAIAAGVRYRGDVLDFFCGEAVLDDALPIGCVLTTAASGSEASATAMLQLEEGRGVAEATSNVLIPSFSVLNPALTETLPAYQVSCGICETLAYLFGLYLEDSQATGVSDRLIEGLMGAIVEETPLVLSDPADVQARADLMWASCMAHNNMCMPGRVPHPVSREIALVLSARLKKPLGSCLSVVLPPVLNLVMERDAARLARLGRRVWGLSSCGNELEDARAAIECLGNYLGALQLPRSLAELGATGKDLEDAVEGTGLVKEALETGNSQVIEHLTRGEAHSLLVALAGRSRTADVAA
ncbi:iron-containing alcohol dehydrogenase [Collinsella sp. KGMB02528]|uniref:Iron-containing alcohol dehydrogenase n=1 Tax=Collinsella acetigenes TaxID=2713419 RepID=A0A7X9UCL7_9ACTN|nr:iron-containing alcohol dehydrogenase [Collinsella acetigenes]NMF56050.1 iron-containing alcohol dehydrogenase [Collinsella acetigenes]